MEELKTKCHWCRRSFGYTKEDVSERQQIVQEGNTMKVVLFQWVNCPSCSRDIRVSE